MSHQPFEDWILDPITLSADDRRALQAHLMECKQCQKLERRWIAVHQQLRTRRMAAPAAGFTARWQASLAERKAREHRRQAWKIFGFLFGGALFILLLLAVYSAATTTPAEWLIALARTYTSSTSMIDLANYAVQSWFSRTPIALNIALWIYMAITLCGLLMVWALIFWRTKTVGATES